MINDNISILENLSKNFFQRAKDYDGKPEFPHRNFDDIVDENLHIANMSRDYGGLGMGFDEIVKLIIKLSEGCSSTGLSLAMHYYSLGGFQQILNEEQKNIVFKDIRENGEFIASVSDPNVLFMFNKEQIESLTTIKARKVPGGYIINGFKPTVTGCPRIKYLPIYCFQEDLKKETPYGLTALLTEIPSEGVTVKESWNYSGMRASMSHDVYFNDVFVPDNYLLGREGYAIEDTQDLIYWFRLAFVSVYHGIAQSAYNHVLKVVEKKRDRISNKPLAFLPGVQYKIAEMKIKLEVSKAQLLSSAQQADRELNNGKFTNDLYTQTLIAKQFVTKIANEIVYMAMQIVGFKSLDKGDLLERLYRDVRAATFHPPTEDLLKEVIGKKELGIISLKKRWV